MKDQLQSLDLRPEDMEEGERHIYEFFFDDENVEKLVRFLSAEEKKGRDKFSGIRFSMFKVCCITIIKIY
jgi:proteasome activator subunit 4